MDDALIGLATSINDYLGSISSVTDWTSDYSSAFASVKGLWTAACIIGSVIFSIFACIELYSCAVKNNAAGGNAAGVEIIAKALFRIAICYMLIQLTNPTGAGNGILGAVFQQFNEFAQYLSNNNTLLSGQTEVIDIEALKEAINANGNFMSELMAGAGALLVMLMAWAASWMGKLLFMMRAIQVFLYVAVAPIPLSTLPSDEFGQIAKGFLKQFVAVCLQGALIVIIMCLFPILVGTANSVFESSGDIMGAFGAAALYSIALIITLVGTQRVAKSICGAM